MTQLTYKEWLKAQGDVFTTEETAKHFYKVYKQSLIDELGEICIWADYDWCYLEDINDYNWKSDDYRRVLNIYDDEPTIEQLKAALGE